MIYERINQAAADTRRFSQQRLAALQLQVYAINPTASVARRLSTSGLEAAILDDDWPRRVGGGLLDSDWPRRVIDGHSGRQFARIDGTAFCRKHVTSCLRYAGSQWFRHQHPWARDPAQTNLHRQLFKPYPNTLPTPRQPPKPLPNVPPAPGRPPSPAPTFHSSQKTTERYRFHYNQIGLLNKLARSICCLRS